jgi:hypothetical protein
MGFVIYSLSKYREIAKKLRYMPDKGSAFALAALAA